MRRKSAHTSELPAWSSRDAGNVKRRQSSRGLILLAFGFVVGTLYLLRIRDAAPQQKEQQKLPDRKCTTFVSVVLPSVVSPERRWQRIQAINATWGRRAHALFVEHEGYGDATGWPLFEQATCRDEDYPRRLVVPSSIGPSEGVARLRWLLTIDVDFAFMCNDHTAVIAPNLVCFLRSISPSEPLYLGHALANGDGTLFNSGAAGYVLSRALLRIVTGKNSSDCWEKTSKWLQGNPGILLARCIKSVGGVLPGDTRDDHGSHRFHAYGLVRTSTATVDDWYIKMHDRLNVWPKSTIRPGTDCCATDTISFHYVEAAEQIALRDGMTAMIGQPIASAEKWLDTHWPKGSDLGAYSHPFPRNLSQHHRQKRAQVASALANKISICSASR